MDFCIYKILCKSPKMSVDNLRLWGNNTFARINTIDLEGVHDYVCLTIPRDTYRRCAMTFNDVRSTKASRYYQMTLQIFLEMLRRTHEFVRDDTIKSVKTNPFMKVYLEFPEMQNRPDQASCYRIHAYALDDQIHFGTALESIISENSRRLKESRTKKRALRINPMENLADYQLYYRITSKEMFYRTIGDWIRKDNFYISRLDRIVGKNKNMDHDYEGNVKRLFHIKYALKETPRNTNPIFCDARSYMVDETPCLPSCKHLIRISTEQLDTAVFMSKYLPDYQQRVRKYSVEPPVQVQYAKVLNDDEIEDPMSDFMDGLEVRSYEQDCMTEYDTHMTRDEEKDKFEEFFEQSDFVITHTRAKNQYDRHVRAFEQTPEFNEKYKEYQKWACEEFEARCFDQDSNISDVGLKMIRWVDKHGHLTFQHRLSDPSMSIFANMIIRKMEECEEFLQISTNHLDYIKIMMGRLDAYRRSFKLHFNMFLTGEGATSKSFLFDLMEAASIPGTVEKLTYQTTKADAVDGNRNDLITVCHEAPPGMFNTSKNKNMDRSQETMFKEKLTSCTVSCKTICIDEISGKRYNRVTKSECIGVWFGATNDDPSDVEQALKTRFYWGNFERRTRGGKDIDDCMTAEQQLSDKDNYKIKNIRLEECATQYRFYVVEKAIYCGIIKDVEMTTFQLLMKQFKEKITKKSIRKFSPRDTERVKIMSRIMCILTAIETVMNLPGGAGFQQRFEIKHVLDIEPLLVVTEEQVRFALTLLDSQYVSPVEDKILRKIYQLNQKKPNYGTHDGTNSEFQNYLILPSMENLIKKIQSNLSAKDGQTSKNNIRSFLMELSDLSIKSKSYKQQEQYKKDNKGKQVYVMDKTGAQVPEVEKYGMAIVDPSTSEESFNMVYITSEAVYMHMAVFEEHKEGKFDPVLKVLKTISHKNSRAKKLITGRIKNNFKSLEIHYHKQNTNVLKMTNLLFSSKASRFITETMSHTENRQQKEIVVNQDLDDYAVHKRAEVLRRDLPNMLQTQKHCWEHHTELQKQTKIDYKHLHTDENAFVGQEPETTVQEPQTMMITGKKRTHEEITPYISHEVY